MISPRSMVINVQRRRPVSAPISGTNGRTYEKRTYGPWHGRTYAMRVYELYMLGKKRVASEYTEQLLNINHSFQILSLSNVFEKLTSEKKIKIERERWGRGKKQGHMREAGGKESPPLPPTSTSPPAPRKGNGGPM